MQIYERVKYLRKKILHLTQEEFALKLNFTRSNLASLEIGRINVTDRVISDICTAFNINENWLRYGSGEIFIDVETFSLDEYAEKQNLTSLEIDIVRSLMGLDKDTREKLVKQLKSVFDKHTNMEVAKQSRIETELDNYRLELEAEEEAKRLSASQHTEESVG